jgi:Ca2+-transporting ATPase
MIYKKLLVPLDGSAISETILPYARSFAKSLKMPVELLHVIDSNVFKLPESMLTQRNVDPPEADLMRRPPRNPRTGIFTRPVLVLMQPL